MVVIQFLRGGHGDDEAVDQLDQRALFIDLSILVAAVLHDLFYVRGLFQASRQVRGGLCVEVHLRHDLFHVVKTEGDVLLHRHVGPQSIVLEKEAHFSLVGGNVDARVRVEDHAVADGDLSGGGCFKACDHAEDGGLAAAGGTKKRNKGIVRDVHGDIVGSVEFTPAFYDMFQFDFRHN